MPAKLKGKEVRIPVSVRMEPTERRQLIKEFGSVQKAIDYFIRLKLKKEEATEEYEVHVTFTDSIP